MAFTHEQMRKLKSSLRRSHIRERRVEDKTLHYLEGWKVVSEANDIFGFEAWDRETVSTECVWRTPHDQGFAAAYVTRVRIRVRAGEQVVIREGLGSAEAIAATPGQAHERAAKAAETDATKRALSTFGSRFGLTLYAERDTKPPTKSVVLGAAAARVVRSVGDRMRSQPLARSHARDGTGPEAAPLADGWRRVRGAHPFTRGTAPDDMNVTNASKTEIEIATRETPLAGARGAGSIAPSEAERPPEGAAAHPPEDARTIALLPVRLPEPDIPRDGRIDKSVLTIPEPRRVRNKAHLKFVATQPCLVCGRQPSHAHHLRIAQPRALGRKVSDEFTVPLCALHHHDLHMNGNEADWWSRRAIDPIPEALRLWRGGEAGDGEP